MLLILIVQLSLVSGHFYRCKPILNNWNNDGYENESWEQVQLESYTHSLTVSGFGSGSSMASNFVAIYNEYIKGAALFMGGGPCATRGYCLERPIKKFDTQGMKGMRIYLLGGQEDSVVKIKSMKATAEWFKKQKAEVRTYYPSYGHIMPGSHMNKLFGKECKSCKDDVAGKALRFLYGSSLKEQDLKYYEKGGLYAFDQSKNQYRSPENSKMHSYGFIYFPKDCNNTSCPTHIHFHDCGQSAAMVGTKHIRESGLLEYASLNKIVMIFPQNNDPNTKPQKHCWESATSSNSQHPQIQAVRDMLFAIYQVDLFYKGSSLKKYQTKPWLNYADKSKKQNSITLRIGQLVSLVFMIQFLQ